MKKLLPHSPLIRVYFISSLILFFGISVYLLFSPRSVDAAWYNSSWSFRKLLVIDESKVSGTSDHVNFPVLVSRTDSELQLHAQTDGDDILFTASDGSTKLMHEIESYNSTTGELVAWVKVPTLDYNDNTSIYMYYGNAVASNQQAACTQTNGSDCAFDGNYKMVMHFNQTSGTIFDSTANNNDSTAVSLTTQGGQIGKISRANEFEEDSNNYVRVNDSASLDLTTNGSIQAWFKRESLALDGNDWDSIVCKGDANNNSDSNYSIEVNNGNTIDARIGGGGNNQGSLPPDFMDIEEWFHVVSTWNGSNFITYINGVIADTDVQSITPIVDTYLLRIGEFGGNVDYFDGIIDEVRVSNSARSADWIATEYANQNDPSSFFTSVSSPQVSTRPELQFSFDEGSGTTANNSGANGVSGTISGATWRSNESCLSGNCLYFDGTDDVVTTSQTTSGVRSVSLWVRPTTTTEQYIDMNGTATISSSAGVVSASGFTSPTIYINGISGASIVANQWNHIVVTSGTSVNASAFKIGQISTNYGQGFFDEVVLYSEQLSAIQVASLYTANGAGPSSAVLGNNSTSQLSDGLVGYWKLDEISTGVAPVSRNDSSGQGFTLTDNNTTASSTGKYAIAADFESSNSESLTVNDNNTLDLTSQITLSAWVNLESFSSGCGSCDVQVLAKGSAFALLIAGDSAASSTIDFYIDSGSGTDYIYPSTNRFTTARWYHLAATYHSGAVRLYIDGELVHEETVAITPQNSSGAFYVGGNHNGYYDGLIDEARIYNRALSSQEIQQLYNWAPGPVGHWKFDEKTGTNVADSGGNQNVGTINGGASWSTGRLGSAVLFDGVDDRVQVSDSSSLDITSSLTISSWIYLASDVSVYATILCKGASYEYCFGLNGSEQLVFDINGGASTCTASSSVSLNTWSHLTGVFNDADNTINLYSNGNSIGQCTNQTSAPDATTEQLDIGAYDSGGEVFGEFFNGRLDDTKLYNYARTNSQLMQDMSEGSLVDSPIAYWSFDEGYGTIANDNTQNNFDLTLSSARWTNNGKFGKAWDGDGTAFLSNNQSTAFTFGSSDSFTISLWSKSDSASNPAESEVLVDRLDYGWGSGYSLSYVTDGTVYCEIDDDATSFPEDSASSSTDYYDGQWHHISCVLNRSTQRLSLYIDGKLVSEDTSVSSTGSIGSSDLIVGNDNGGANFEFNGNIDDFKIYRAALSPADILTDYNQGKSLVFGSSGTNSTGSADNSASREYCVPGDATSCNAPIAHWKLDEGNWSNNCSTDSVFDTSGNNFSGDSCPNSTGPLGGSIGKVGKAGDFDGSDDYISITDTTGSALDITASITLSAWVYPHTIPASTNQSRIIDKDGAYNLMVSTNDTGCLAGGTGDVVFRVFGTSANRICGGTLPLNQWSYVVGTYTGNSMNIYVNGVLTTTYTGFTSSITANDSPVYIGNSSTSARYFDGLIDDVRIYNYARTPAQIAWDYNKGKPVAHWQFDESSGNTAYDNSGNSLNGTLVNSPTRTNAAKFNLAVDFDGIDDYVQVNDTAGSVFDAASVSLSAWVNADSWVAYSNIVQKGDINGRTYSLQVNGSGQLLSETPQVITSNVAMQTGVWNHVVGVFDTVNDLITFYINGKLDSSVAFTGSLANNDQSITIGADFPGADEYFNGRIDDIRIYNYPLTAEQVKLIMNDGAAIKFN